MQGKTAVVYHRRDLDGVCSAAILWRGLENPDLFPWDYGDSIPAELDQYDAVYVVDCCFDQDKDLAEMRRLAEKTRFVWLDHHKSAIETAARIGFRPPGARDVTHAGCELTWMSCRQVQMPQAVHLLGRYDVWDHSDPDTLAFQWGARAAEGIMDPKHGIWGCLLATRYEDTFVHILAEGRIILRYEKERCAQVMHGAHEVVLRLVLVPACALPEGNVAPEKLIRCIACNVPRGNSQMFDSVWDPKKYDAMLAYYHGSRGDWVVSLYSDKPEVDCSEIAQHFGGGGHRGAAGWTATTDWMCQNIWR